ncbi:hypothetical protein Tco_0227783 [Tanacetum coccineum]
MNDLKWVINWTSAGQLAAASRGGGTGVEPPVGCVRRTRGRSSDQGNGRDDDPGGQVGGQGSEMNGDQGRGQGNGRNQNDNAVNDNIRGDVSRGCTYKEFLACNQKEYDGKGERVKYTAGSFVGKALTWWNSEIRTRGREAAVGMSWEDFKTLTREELCPSNEMQKLETELCHAMLGASHAAYRFQRHFRGSSDDDTYLVNENQDDHSVCDVPLVSISTPLECFKEHSEDYIDSKNDYSSSDANSYENIDYVDASPPDAEIVSLEVVEIVIPEVGGIDTDILLTIKDDILREKLLNVLSFIANIEALKDNPTHLPGSTTTRSDYSLPDYEAFYSDDDHIKEKSSSSTTTHADFSQYDSFIFDLLINQFPPADRSDFYHEEFADELAHIISPPEYDHFCFKIEPELDNLTMNVVEDIFPTREPRVHTLDLDIDFILFSDSLFAYIVWIFLPFLTYPVAPPYLLSCGNEDTIFDPDISVYHSFMPGLPGFLKPLVLAVLSFDHKSFKSSASFGNPIS